MKLLKCIVALAALMGVLASQSHAAIVQYTFGAGAGAADGTTFGGTFLFDSDTNMFSDINVTATGGAFGNLTFIATGAPANNDRIFFLTGTDADATGLFALDIGFTGPVLGTAGSLGSAVSFGAFYECENPVCSFTGVDANSFGVLTSIFLDTAIVGTEVPLPAAAWLFLAGVGALTTARRKRKAIAD